MLYPEHAFLDRFAAAAQDGFVAVEYLFPYEFPAAELKGRLQAHSLQQVLFNAPPGDWTRGERGLACLPGRTDEFRASVLRALDYATALACPRIHVMAGLMPPDVSPERAWEHYLESVRWAAQAAAPAGIEVLIEPINTRDMPGYFLNRQEQAHQALDAVQMSNLKVQMDLYHCQITDGDISTRLRKYVPTGRIGHIQIASVPLRHEPDAGELHYPYLFSLLDELNYRGWVGCEYRPARGGEPGATSAGLAWFTPYRSRTP